MQELYKSFMGINLRITTVLIICVSGCLSLPKIADATGEFSSLVVKGLAGAEQSLLANSDSSLEGEDDTYVPPNFGRPDSQHGSGTR
ncbi:hypothetical protein [Nostoc sp. FACHB-110]|uniref:hypothetical protein n=1 Tax=Nostoc sp. FACHB-110 TaxID=2692834 RepID=UPI0016838DE2|nr:hypothetical protein [Nostoc sp. FACHB-110]MBD2436171.1 hypothetical protein [Nostoc sp. FACHB-110]